MKSTYLPIASIDDVVQRQLCTGCGVCAALEPQTFAMQDSIDWGRRPMRRADSVPEAGWGLAACPGIELDIRDRNAQPGILPELVAGWGPVREVWEGYASDPRIRLAGSSGGAATALAQFAIEQAGMEAVLHTAADPQRPLVNQSVVSRTLEELLERTGSRYAPASPCDSIHDHFNVLQNPVVFIGKPCDVAAVVRACSQREDWTRKIGLTIAFFCAGTPSTRGTLELLAEMGLNDPSRLRSLRYRGKGWPGMFTAEWLDDNGNLITRQLTYEQSWGHLQRYRQWRCYICPDHTGEFADISVGDPWYREIHPDEPGSSLIIVRTERGQQFLARAAAAGYVRLLHNDASLLARSQPNLLKARGELWARLMVLRWMGAAVPSFRGFSMRQFWWRLPLIKKIRSFTGTWKRVYRKRLRQRIPLAEFQAPINMASHDE